MKILVECLWALEAGSTFTYGLASGLKENGHEVCCILSEEMRNLCPWEETFGPANLSFIRTTPKKKNPISTGIPFLADCLKTRKQFRDSVFDLAIRTFSHPFDITVLNCVKRKRLVSVCHDPVTHSSMNPKIAAQYREEIKKADDIIVLTRSFIPVIEKEYGKDPSRIHYMRHGLMTYPHTTASPKSSPEKGIQFLFFGRIEGYKGLGLLSDAYREISARYPKTSLVIAGNGDFHPYAESYQQLPNVTILNRYIRDDEVAELFETGNTVAVLPYLDATQSGVIPIAFEFGVPVIASNAGGLPEQLFDGEYGILFESGNVHSLAEAMETFLKDPVTYTIEASKMRAGREKLEWKNVTAALLEQWIPQEARHA